MPYVLEILLFFIVSGSLNSLLLKWLMKAPPAEACCNIPVHKLPETVSLSWKYGSPAISSHLLSTFMSNLPHKPVPVLMELTALCWWAGRHRCFFFSSHPPLPSPITHSGGQSVGAQVKFCRFQALKGLLWISNSSLWAVLTPAVDTDSTFPSKTTSAAGRCVCGRAGEGGVGVIPIYFFPSAAFMLTVNLSGSRCPVALSKAKA